MTRFRLLACAVVLSLSAVQAAHAQSVVVSSGTTRTTTITLGFPGDSLTVEAGGTIAVTGADAVDMADDDQSAHNAGVITTSGNNAFGILSIGDGIEITSSGTIMTDGDDAYGIYSDGFSAVIINSGTIETSGDAAFGIEADGPSATISNDGVIITGGDAAFGILSDGDDAVIGNNGVVTTSGLAAFGIYSDGLSAVITNNGTIKTSGNTSFGILSLGDGASIRNSGTIAVSGIDADGIESVGADAVIVNSGTVISTAGYSIYSAGFNATLKLLPGSVLVGALHFSDFTTATLDIARGLSTALRFDTCFCAGIPATIDAHGAPLAVSDEWVYTADVTALIAQGQMLGDLTDAIYGALDGGRAAGAANTPPLGYAPENMIARDLAIFRDGEAKPVREAWVKGFGGSRDQDSHGLDMGSEQKLAGFVSGMDFFATQGWVGGAFIGGSWAKADVENSQTLEAQSVFGGVYASRDVGTARLDLAALVGWSDYDSKRQVADNTDPDGTDIAKADYDGWFVSPRVALTQPFMLGPQHAEVSLSAHYAGLFLDSYEEHGAQGALEIDRRQVHLLLGRAALALPTDYVHPDGGLTRLTPTLGVQGRTQFGDDDVEGTLAGIDIDFSTGKDKALGAFAGLRLEHETARGLNLFAAAEGLIEDDGSTRFSGKGGLRLRF